MKNSVKWIVIALVLVGVIAGASILGDGSVSLIIDVSQLLELGVKQELSARSELNSFGE